MNLSARTLVLVNPVAGAGRAKRIQPDVAAYFRDQGFAADFLESRSVADLRERAAEAAAGGYSAIVALGGDGTFRHLVEATLGAKVVLGFIPAGGGNDVARALGLPDDSIAAARAFLRSRPRPIDVIQARTASGKTGVYVGGGGLGLDAQTAQLANGRFRRLRGAVRYVTCVLAAVSSFEPFRVQMELDGNPTVVESGPLLLAAVANAPAYGAGVKIAPRAAMNDGLLDIVLVSNMPRVRLIELLPVMLQTGKVGEPEIQRFRARCVVLRADRRVLFHGDGEVIGEAPLEIEALPGAIHVAAPAHA